MFICRKNQLHPWVFFLRYCKEISQTCYFGYFGHEWQCPAKLIVSTYRKTWFWSACKKSSSYLPSFLWFCKDIANLLFWVLWACLAMASKNNGINLLKTLMFIFMQKIKFTPHLFLEILLRYCKLVILGTLGMAHHPHQNQWYQLEGNFNIYLHAKNQKSISR